MNVSMIGSLWIRLAARATMTYGQAFAQFARKYSSYPSYKVIPLQRDRFNNCEG